MKKFTVSPEPHSREVHPGEMKADRTARAETALFFRGSVFRRLTRRTPKADSP